MRTIFPVLAAIGAAAVLAAPRADAQLTSAELYVNVDAGASAFDEGVPSDVQSFSDGPRTEDVFLLGGTIPWHLQAVAGGGSASTMGEIVYLATNTSQIFTRGDFTMGAAAAAPAAALAGFDVVLSISFQVENATTYTLSGYVQTGRELDGPEIVACQIDGVVLAGDSRATPLPAGTYAIDAQRTLYPGETAVLQCAAASSGGSGDSNALAWEVAVEGLPEPGAAASTLLCVGSLAAVGRIRRGARRRA